MFRQIDKTGSHAPHIKQADGLFKTTLALHSSQVSFSRFLIWTTSSVGVPGLNPPSTWVFLTQSRRASG